MSSPNRNVVDSIISSLAKGERVKKHLETISKLPQEEFQNLLDILKEYCDNKEYILFDTELDLIKTTYALNYGKMHTKNNCDTVSFIICRLCDGDSVKNFLQLINCLPKEHFQKLLADLSGFYYNGESLISDSDYDLIESIYTLNYGKNLAVGATPTEKPILSKIRKSKSALKKSMENNDNTISRPSGSKPSVVLLPVPMYGLDKLKDDHGLGLYKKRYKNCYSYIVTDKLDGNSVYLEYSTEGVCRLLKRGDHKEGVDISYLLPFISHPELKENFAIRAELVMPLKIFAEKYQDDSNTRNTVSGLTNSKTALMSKIKDIDLVAYHIYSGSPLPQSEQLVILEQKGFKIPSWTALSAENLTAETLTAEVKFRKRRSAYDIDGICLAADLPMSLPTNKDPEHVVAFKILGDTAITTVIGLEWNISKRGLYKPRVNFEKTRLDGADLNWATGNNARFVIEYGLGPGAVILITRSGGVVAKILETEKKVTPQLPDVEYRWTENDKGEKVDIALIEGAENEDQEIKKIVSFFKERNSEFLAKKTIVKLYDAGLNSLKDLFHATVEDIIDIDGFQRKGAERIVKNIKHAITNAPLYEIMAASSLFPGFGKKRLELITKEIPRLNEVDDLNQLDDIRDKILNIGQFKKLAEVFVDKLLEFNMFLKNHPEIKLSIDDSIDTFSEDDNADNNADNNADEKQEGNIRSGTLAGQTIVFSGTRADTPLQRKIDSQRGRICSAVSGQTTILVVKDLKGKETTKIKEARAKGILVIGLNDFLSKYELE